MIFFNKLCFALFVHLSYFQLIHNAKFENYDLYSLKDIDVVVKEAPKNKTIADVTEFPQRMFLSAPFIVRVYVYNDLKCTGTLLNYTWVITSAQCVYQYPLNNIRVQRFRDSLLNQVEITKKILHESFKRDPHPVNDIALLKMLHSFKKFNQDFYKPLVLPSKLILDVGKMLFDCIQYALDTKKCPDIRLSSSSNQLRVFNAKPSSHDRCKLLYPDIKRSQLCITVVERRNLMGSELGAPLICRNVLYGIFSFYQEPIENLISKNCNETSQSTKIYSRIDVHYNWILKHAVTSLKKNTAASNRYFNELNFIPLILYLLY